MPREPKTIVRLGMRYGRMPIDEAIHLLTAERVNGATHVGGLEVQWREPAPPKEKKPA